MAQSFSAIYPHSVFSTRERRQYFKDAILRGELHAFLGGVARTLECTPLQIGGVEDHVHLLIRVTRTLSTAEIVKELKRHSNVWFKEKSPEHADFSWQGGYAAFSVSVSSIDAVRRYIENQEEHHKKVDFKDELRALLKRHGVEWDERYAWD
ncbi:IS200/IS605 family transposase [Verrucomicrobium sp. BvORR106]|uniref:IS200/IS605 family transposase n=1 Tax=Verrucomicrobium sp. BvORR106 TaxID=1403819 RepID=UPI00056FEB18|nr:IS200/IS605 family transposase [Verrucomicrobium sp. BvORR106]